MCTQHPDVHLAEYDWFFAVDTNTNMFRGKSVSVSCVSGGRAVRVPAQDPPSYNISYRPVLYYEFWDQAVRPEPFAWELLINDLINDPRSSASDKVAILVDSELGRIETINKCIGRWKIAAGGGRKVRHRCHE
jgi:hypothetical protein